MTTRKPPQKRKKSAKQTKSLMTFNVIAIAVVAALVFGAVGVAVFDELLNDSGDTSIEVDQDQVDKIEQGFRDQIADDPNDVAAMSALANYLGNTGKADEAILWYEKALSITPDDMALRLDFASALVSGGSQSDAELQYKRVIEAEPENAFALLGLARLYRSWSPPRTQDAVTYYQLAIDRGGESVVSDVASSEMADLTGTPAASPESSPMGSPEGAP